MGITQPQHQVGADGLQRQFTVQGNDLQPHAGVAPQQRDQVASQDVMQNRLGHGQANQGLIVQRRRAFVGQSDQSRLQLPTFASEGQGAALEAEQRALQPRLQLRQLLAQPGCLDVEATGRLHEAAATGTDQETLRHLRFNTAGQCQPGIGDTQRRAVCGDSLASCGLGEGHG
ncbi:hypothetical protein D3C76_1203080 [compost metagenome]